jgi:hypothetical protein
MWKQLVIFIGIHEPIIIYNFHLILKKLLNIMWEGEKLENLKKKLKAKCASGMV